jgi:vacuolar-type H+-ATPase subunit E/Vma4
VIPEIQTRFKNLIIKEGIDPSVGEVDLRIDDKFFLEEPITTTNTEEKINKNSENTKCFGGVMLTSEDGLIVCKNTLDNRIDLAYQQMLPIIRQNLFQ